MMWLSWPGSRVRTFLAWGGAGLEGEWTPYHFLEAPVAGASAWVDWDWESRAVAATVAPRRGVRSRWLLFWLGVAGGSSSGPAWLPDQQDQSETKKHQDRQTRRPTEGDGGLGCSKRRDEDQGPKLEHGWTKQVGHHWVGPGIAKNFVWYDHQRFGSTIPFFAPAGKLIKVRPSNTGKEGGQIVRTPSAGDRRDGQRTNAIVDFGIIRKTQESESLPIFAKTVNNRLLSTDLKRTDPTVISLVRLRNIASSPKRFVNTRIFWIDPRDEKAFGSTERNDLLCFCWRNCWSPPSHIDKNAEVRNTTTQTNFGGLREP